MTEQNWRDLPAGRELDRLVAERMGYEVIDYARDWVGLDDVPPDPVFKPERDADGALQLVQPVPHYSRRVDAALALAPVGEGARYVPFKLTLGYDLRNDRPGKWHATFGAHYQESAATPAHAIVRAWLAWKDGTA